MALMVKVAVALYDPVLYFGSLVRLQVTEPASPPVATEWASVPKVATLDWAVVDAVWAVLHAVPDAVVQV